MAGLGYRRDMADWDMARIDADFFEVVPENWIRRDRDPLYRLIASGRPVHLHGVSLNLGGTAPLDIRFLRDLRGLIDDLGARFYSDHLAASGDAHQLYDLFPVPFTASEAERIADRIRGVQDLLGRRIAIENATWYTNVGDIPEPEFLSAIAERADCDILLDINNIAVNFKNHGLIDVPTAYNWDPVTFANGVTESDVLGIEAPLWSETLLTIRDIEFLAFPRLPGYAEIAWSPQTDRAWADYRVRLAAHGAYLSALGVNFYRAPEIDWQP